MLGQDWFSYSFFKSASHFFLILLIYLKGKYGGKTLLLGEGSNYFHSIVNEQERGNISLNDGRTGQGDRRSLAAITGVQPAGWKGHGWV